LPSRSKSLQRKPKLVKEYGCPNARAEKVAAKLKKVIENINGQLVTIYIVYGGLSTKYEHYSNK